MEDTRGKAYAILSNVFENRAYSNIAIDTALKNSTMDGRDRAFVTNIVYGVLTNLSLIDYQIAHYSKIAFKKLSPRVLIILRLSLYQLLFMDKVPDSAAVNEGVKLAKRIAYKSSGFINAVLRAFTTGGMCLPDESDRMNFLSVKYSYPEWIVELWTQQLGEEECELLLQAGNLTPPLTIRVNSLKTTPAELKELIGAEDTCVSGALNLTSRGSVSQMQYFKDGYFTVQDAAAQKVSLVLAPDKNDRVLDMCAAPGGKTTHIAELLQGSGAVVAWDKYAHKIVLIEKALQRLGLKNITAYVHDAGDADPSLFESFDKVLLDAPCSGLGIIRKKPDIKWLRTPDDIEEIKKEQKRLLVAAAYYVKPGGRLVYSTCTINRAENEDMAQEFLSEHADFELEGDYITMYPHKTGTDGFFICSMKRKNINDEHLRPDA